MVTAIQTEPFVRSLDLTGKAFGKLLVTSRSVKNKHGSYLWMCICECGNECSYSTGKLKNKKAVSCGCVWTENKRTVNGYKGHTQKPYGVSSFNTLYRGYVRNARDRGHSFTLDEKTFRAITSMPCHYCGAPPTQVRPTNGKLISNGEYLHNGIDRADNAVGYDDGNVRPCCKQCNFAKGALNEREFILWIQRITAYIAARSWRF